MKQIILLATAILITGCASDRIIVDRKTTDMSNYQRDLAECRSYAEEVPAGAEVATGAVGGAVVGGVLGAIVGDSKTASKAAGAGSVSGAVRGGARAGNEKDRVVKNCLRNRGYQVLN